MIRRVFWMLVGLVLGVAVLRKLDELSRASRPTAVAERTGRRVGGTQARWRDAVAVGRDAARQREAELRTRYGVPTLIDLAALERGAGDQPDDPTSQS